MAHSIAALAEPPSTPPKTMASNRRSPMTPREDSLQVHRRLHRLRLLLPLRPLQGLLLSENASKLMMTSTRNSNEWELKDSSLSQSTTKMESTLVPEQLTPSSGRKSYSTQLTRRSGMTRTQKCWSQEQHFFDRIIDDERFTLQMLQFTDCI